MNAFHHVFFRKTGKRQQAIKALLNRSVNWADYLIKAADESSCGAGSTGQPGFQEGNTCQTGGKGGKYKQPNKDDDGNIDPKSVGWYSGTDFSTLTSPNNKTVQKALQTIADAEKLISEGKVDEALAMPWLESGDTIGERIEKIGAGKITGNLWSSALSNLGAVASGQQEPGEAPEGIYQYTEGETPVAEGEGILQDFGLGPEFLTQMQNKYQNMPGHTENILQAAQDISDLVDAGNWIDASDATFMGTPMDAYLADLEAGQQPDPAYPLAVLGDKLAAKIEAAKQAEIAADAEAKPATTGEQPEESPYGSKWQTELKNWGYTAGEASDLADELQQVQDLINQGKYAEALSQNVDSTALQQFYDTYSNPAMGTPASPVNKAAYALAQQAVNAGGAAPTPQTEPPLTDQEIEDKYGAEWQAKVKKFGGYGGIPEFAQTFIDIEKLVAQGKLQEAWDTEVDSMPLSDFYYHYFNSDPGADPVHKAGFELASKVWAKMEEEAAGTELPDIPGHLAGVQTSGWDDAEKIQMLQMAEQHISGGGTWDEIKDQEYGGYGVSLGILADVYDEAKAKGNPMPENTINHAMSNLKKLGGPPPDQAMQDFLGMKAPLAAAGFLKGPEIKQALLDVTEKIKHGATWDEIKDTDVGGHPMDFWLALNDTSRGKIVKDDSIEAYVAAMYDKTKQVDMTQAPAPAQPSTAPAYTPPVKTQPGAYDPKSVGQYSGVDFANAGLNQATLAKVSEAEKLVSEGKWADLKKMQYYGIPMTKLAEYYDKGHKKWGNHPVAEAMSNLKKLHQGKLVSLPANTQASPAVPNAIDGSQFKKVGGKLGTEEGGVYEYNGEKYYVKTPSDPARMHNELLANKLYDLAGSKTKETNLIDMNGKAALASKWVDSQKIDWSDAALKAKAQEDFAVHAWLNNWDAVGAGSENPKDNIQIMPDGSMVMLDAGGALEYKGMGGSGKKKFDAQALEWNTLRDPSINPSMAEVFGNMTPDQLIKSAEKVTGLTDNDIDSLVNQFGYGSQADKIKLAETLKKRRDYIADQVQALKPAEAPAKPPEALLQGQPVFLNNGVADVPAVSDFLGHDISGYSPESAADIAKIAAALQAGKTWDEIKDMKVGAMPKGIGAYAGLKTQSGFYGIANTVKQKAEANGAAQAAAAAEEVGPAIGFKNPDGEIDLEALGGFTGTSMDGWSWQVQSNTADIAQAIQEGKTWDEIKDMALTGTGSTLGKALAYPKGSQFQLLAQGLKDQVGKPAGAATGGFLTPDGKPDVAKLTAYTGISDLGAWTEEVQGNVANIAQSIEAGKSWDEIKDLPLSKNGKTLEQAIQDTSGTGVLAKLGKGLAGKIAAAGITVPGISAPTTVGFMQPDGNVDVAGLSAFFDGYNMAQWSPDVQDNIANIAEAIQGGKTWDDIKDLSLSFTGATPSDLEQHPTWKTLVQQMKDKVATATPAAAPAAAATPSALGAASTAYIKPDGKVDLDGLSDYLGFEIDKTGWGDNIQQDLVSIADAIAAGNSWDDVGKITLGPTGTTLEDWAENGLAQGLGTISGMAKKIKQNYMDGSFVSKQPAGAGPSLIDFKPGGKPAVDKVLEFIGKEESIGFTWTPQLQGELADAATAIQAGKNWDDIKDMSLGSKSLDAWAAVPNVDWGMSGIAKAMKDKAGSVNAVQQSGMYTADGKPDMAAVGKFAGVDIQDPGWAIYAKDAVAQAAVAIQAGKSWDEAGKIEVSGGFTMDQFANWNTGDKNTVSYIADALKKKAQANQATTGAQPAATAPAAGAAAPAPPPMAVPKPPTINSKANAHWVAKFKELHEAAEAGDLAKVEAYKTSPTAKNTYSKKFHAYKQSVLAAMKSGGKATTAPTTPTAAKPGPAAKPAGGAAAPAYQATPLYQPMSASQAAKLVPKIDPAQFPAEPTFVSSNAAQVAANNAKVAEAKKLAEAGDLAALQALPVHPSVKVQQYVNDLKTNVSAQLNPPKSAAAINATVQDISSKIPHLKQVNEAGLEKIGYWAKMGDAGGAPVGVTMGTWKPSDIENKDMWDKGYAAYKKAGKAGNLMFRYTDGWFEQYNDALRSDGKILKAKDDYVAATQAAKAILEHGSVLPEGQMLSRKYNIASIDMAQALQPGLVVSDKAILSTSANMNVWSGAVHMRLKIGPGVKGMPAKKFSDHPSEQEYLLAPNQRILITSVTDKYPGMTGISYDGRWIVEGVILETHDDQF